MRTNKVVHTERLYAAAFQIMNELRLKRELCDIILNIHETRFKAHKIVLAGCSPYLRAMFTNGMLETESSFVEIRGVEADTMSLLLDYMYTGCIELTVDNVQNLLQGASLLSLHELRHQCALFLQSQLEPSNCLGIERFADIYMCKDLRCAAREYIYDKFLEIIHHEEFMQLPLRHVLSLLKSPRIRVNSEHEVCDAAFSWLQYDAENRACHTYRLVDQIALSSLDYSYLENVVLRSPFVLNCAKCQLIVSEAVVRMHESRDIIQTPNMRASPPSIFVVGGRNNSLCQLQCSEQYSFIQDKWMPMSNMKTARTAVGACTLDGCMYVVGGECATMDQREVTNYLSTMEQYEPLDRSWSSCPDMGVARSFVAVITAYGCIYAIGGESHTSSYNVIERYDPASNSWSYCPSMHCRRSGAGVTFCDGKIYVAGGYDKSLHIDRASIECYDIEQTRWHYIAEMEQPRSGLGMITVADDIYMFGGRQRNMDDFLRLVDKFNTVTLQWTSLTPMHMPRAWPGVVFYLDYVYIIGGFDGANRLGSVECYDIKGGKSSYMNSMCFCRAGCGAAII